MNKELIQEQEKYKLPIKMFRSPWLIIMEAMYATSAALMLLSLIRLVDPAHRSSIIYGLVEQEVAGEDALATWFAVVIITEVMFTFYSVAMTIGFGKLLYTVFKCNDEPCKIKGLGFLAAVNRVAIWTWVALLGVLAIVFSVKLTLYTIALVGETVDFAFPLMAVIIGEAVMLLILVGLTVFLILAWRDLAFLSDHLRYMLYTGKVEGYVQSFCGVSLIVVSLISLYLSTFFFFDVVLVIAFLLLAAASMILGVCIIVLRKKVEQINYNIYLKRKKDKHQS